MKKLMLGAMLVVATLMSSSVAAYVLNPLDPENLWELKTFRSKQELEDFIAKALDRVDHSPFFGYRSLEKVAIASEAGVATPASTPEYSATNIQVTGVDEADIIKNDGRFLYLALDKRFVIVEAYPPEEMKVVSASSLVGRILGLFINGDRLIVFEEFGLVYEPAREASREMFLPRFNGFHIKVYDVSNRKDPILIRNVFLNGTYVNSRMIGDFVYIVASQPAIQDRNEVVLPTMSVDGDARVVPATQIHYSNTSDIPVTYTLIVALNVQEEDREPEFEVILTGYATSIYVSQKNIYVTMPLGSWWTNEGSTVIHRIAVDGQNIAFEASGEVPGRVLNQFSMDEYDDHFRIATTIGHVGRGQATSSNNMYILDSKLNIVGRLEELAPGERIHSARFMDERCYLVTFKKIDPLFTIDVSNPREPKVLGKLKIPGYSDYLHPYDESHIIGIGKETVEAEEGDFAWYQGLKISLFNVEDVEKPKEVGKLIIGDRGTESPVLWDHHALLLDHRRSLLVIPVLEAKIFLEKYPQGVPPSTQGEYIFQGAYILNIAPEEGISVRGRITHIEDPQIFLKSGYYLTSEYQVVRSLYIGEALYTISSQKIVANSLVDLTEISSVRLR